MSLVRYILRALTNTPCGSSFVQSIPKSIHASCFHPYNKICINSRDIHFKAGSVEDYFYTHRCTCLLIILHVIAQLHEQNPLMRLIFASKINQLLQCYLIGFKRHRYFKRLISVQ